MTEQQWTQLPPDQQADAWLSELGGMLRDAAATLHFTPGNGDTEVENGLTIVVSRKERQTQ